MAKSKTGSLPSWRFRPVPLRDVRITGGFWSERQETNRLRSIPHILEKCVSTGRIEALRLGWKPGQTPVPHIFWDSDVAKWLEAACYGLLAHPDPGLEGQVGEVVELLERAQTPDGYLNSHFIQVEPDKRWTNLRDCHELYCAGHLIEAAVAHAEATGSRRFLDVMCRYADHIARIFGPEPGKKRGYPGHEEIELALVKLARATGEGRYLRLAEYFVLERGRTPSYYDLESRERGEEPKRLPHGSRAPYEYCQAHLPVTEQRTAEGHAVRAMYLYSAMADLAAETGSAALLKACRALWQNVTARRMYVTGGVGSAGQGERFTTDYDLPNESAYAESCAAIGLVFWAHRMLAIEADGRYGDVLEQALYNGVLASLSLDGRAFFYVNKLAAHGAGGEEWRRRPWFDCACCPPNIARLLASLGSYVYGAADDGIAVHLYAESEADFRVRDVPVRLSQRTDYPWKEQVRLAVDPERPVRLSLWLRVPSWCERPKLSVNGKRVDLAACTRRGYARIPRFWSAGDAVALELPMPARRVHSHPAVRANGGRVALARGPLVYCLEQADNGACLDALKLPRSARFRTRRAGWIPGGGVSLEAAARRDAAVDWKGALYRTRPSRSTPRTLRAIPYYAWCNRSPGEMLVWVREAGR